MAFFSRESQRSFLAATVLLSLAFAASSATAQEPLPPIQFNAPYRCADGTTYVIERCVPVRKGEVCYFRMEMAGQPPKEAYNIRSQLTGILNTCPAQASPQAAQSGKPGAAPSQPPALQLNVPYHCANNVIVVVKHCENKNGAEVCSLVKGEPNGPLGDEISLPKSQAAAIALMCSPQNGGPSPQSAGRSAGGMNPKALAQPPGPNYTADMPSVERVKAEIKGSDPTDTLARQVAVLTYLSTYIQRIKYNRTIDGPYTPEELRVMGAYDLANYQIKQDYKKSHTAAETEAFDHLEGHYQFDTAFNQDWNKRLMGPQSKAAYQGMERDLGARQAAHVESIKSANEEARKASAGADRSADPTAVATRRCLELGGAPSACLTKGLKAGASGLMEMVGINLDAMEGPRKAGLVLSGSYRGPRALASLDFGTNTASISGCGKLVPEPRGYTITKGPNSLVVTVYSGPRDLLLTTRPDGGLSGPGLVDVKGKVISGYHTETTTVYANGSPLVDASCGGVCSKSVTVPDYAPKIERCTIGSLNAPPPASAAATPSGFDTGIGGFMMGVLDAGPTPLPGLRMTGKYSSSGLQFEFSENSVILDCGQAHARQPYTVENASGDVRIHVQNSGGPFTLALLPNNTLRGSGSTTVNGRLVTGMQGENVTYAPRSERCELGTYAPASGASPAASDGAPAPSVSAPSAPAAPTADAARLLISSAFPAGANPLVGKPIFLYRDSLANVLRKAGASVAPNATAGEALRTTVTSCRPPADCKSMAAAMESLKASQAVIDSAGRAAISPAVPPGRYYVSGSARNGGSVLVWDIKVDLKPGDNSVVLEQSNAETVH